MSARTSSALTFETAVREVVFSEARLLMVEDNSLGDEKGGNAPDWLANAPVADGGDIPDGFESSLVGC